MPLKVGALSLRVKTKHFNRNRKSEDRGAFILDLPGSPGRIGLAWFSIYHKEELYHEKRGRAGFKIEANSAVLFDIVIEPDWQGKGIGSESLRFMKKYAKSRGAQRFYAHYVKPGRERFFAKAGFVRTDADPDWWIMREF